MEIKLVDLRQHFETPASEELETFNVEPSDHPHVWRGNGFLDGDSLSLIIMATDSTLTFHYYVDAVEPWNQVTIQFDREVRSLEEAFQLGAQVLGGLQQTERLLALGFLKEVY